MSNSVTFSSPLNFGPIGPGQTANASTTQSGTLSAPVNVTAGITGDANHVFSVLWVTSFQLETITETPDPGESKGPLRPIKVQTAVQIDQSNGARPLHVATGQYVEVTVQFAPTLSSPNTCRATLQITETRGHRSPSRSTAR